MVVMQLSVGQQYGGGRAEGSVLNANKAANTGIEDA